MKLAQVTAIAVGGGLMASPALVDYADTAAADVHRTVGPLVLTGGVIALWAATRDVRLVGLPLAAVLAAAPLVADHPAAATAVGLGAATAVAVTAPFGGADPGRRGPGWWGVLHGTEREEVAHP